MATICGFGTAPDLAKDGYRIIRTIAGTDASVLAEFADSDVRLVRGPSIFGEEGKAEFAVMARTQAPHIMTDDQIADAAVTIVLGALPYPRVFMEQLKCTDLPIMLADGTIHGPAPDNAAVFEKYPADWTGLAASSHGGKLGYWFVYRCGRFQERALACLGHQQSVGAAIVAAAQHVRADLKYWNTTSKAA